MITELTRRLRRARETIHGHTHEQAAGALGTTKNLYGRWERGEGYPQPRHYAALANYLGVDDEEVYRLITDAKGHGPKAARPSPAGLSDRMDGLELRLHEVEAQFAGRVAELRDLVARLIDPERK